MKIRFFTYFLTLASVSLISVSCIQIKATTGVNAKTSENGRSSKSIHLMQSVLWEQNAAEYRALCYQAFNTAKRRLDDYLKYEDNSEKKSAIITDIDETVLDNSPYEAKLIVEDQTYTSEEWDNWVQQKNAKAVPGAAKFLNYAKSKGVEIFYISNRDHGQENATIANMKKVNFPYADKAHLLFKKETSSKKNRFEEVQQNFNVILFMGDNLSDFSSKFRTPSTDKRNALADYLKEQFGKKFIVLPNPMYGDWETKGIFKGEYDWSETQKDSIRRNHLNTY